MPSVTDSFLAFSRDRALDFCPLADSVADILVKGPVLEERSTLHTEGDTGWRMENTSPELSFDEMICYVTILLESQWRCVI